MAHALRSALTVTRNVCIVAGIGGVTYGAYRYVLKFGNLDPFKNFTVRKSDLDANTSIRLSDVELRHYHDGKLVTKARLGNVSVSKDRTSFTLSDITDGLYYSSSGKVNFAAAHGIWNALTEHLSVDGGARVKGDKFDIQTPVVNFDKRGDSLLAPQPLRGSLYGGKILASSLNYNLKTGDSSALGVRWQGKVDSAQIDPTSDSTTRRWDFSGDYHRSKGKDIFLHGTATDGEVLIIAPYIERDIKTEVITATGTVTYFSGKSDLIADKAVIYRKDKKAVFTGHVRMLVKPKKDQDQKPKVEEIPPFKPEIPASIAQSRPAAPSAITEEQKAKDEELRSGKTLRDYPLQVQADQITYWYQKGARKALIEGSPEARQDFTDGRWRQGWTDVAHYDGELDTMQLDSVAGKRNARLKNSIGDVWTGSMLKFSTKEDEDESDEDITGTDAKGTFVDRSDEVPKDTKKAPPPPPPGKSTGG